MRVKATLASLTEGDDDVLVNASNTELRLGSGVSAAISRACGPGYQAILDEHLASVCGGNLDHGDVTISSAGRHPRARAVAHVAVMDYRGGVSARSFPSSATLDRAFAVVWPRIDALAIPRARVAMVALGAGTGGLGVRDSIRAAAESLRAHASTGSTNIDLVTFYGISIVEHAAIAAALADVFPSVLDDLSEDARQLVAGIRGVGR